MSRNEEEDKEVEEGRERFFFTSVRGFMMLGVQNFYEENNSLSFRKNKLKLWLTKFQIVNNPHREALVLRE